MGAPPESMIHVQLCIRVSLQWSLSSSSTRDPTPRPWRGGARWKVSDATSLSLEGTHEERGGDEAPSDALMLRLSARF